MSQFYIAAKHVFAWPEEKDGKPGYTVCYRYGQPDEYRSWCPKEPFEAANLPMGHDNDGSKITQAMVDGFIKAVDVKTIGQKTTVVQATLANGFEIVESSSCVDPKNYDEKVGVSLCTDKINQRIWHLLGFLLQYARCGL